MATDNLTILIAWNGVAHNVTIPHDATVAQVIALGCQSFHISSTRPLAIADDVSAERFEEDALFCEAATKYNLQRQDTCYILLPYAM